MKRSKLIFAGLILIVAILSVGMVMGVSDSNKTDTKLKIKVKSPVYEGKIKVKSPVYEGDKVKITLIDVNNTTIANKTIKITLKDEDNEKYTYSIVTNKKGVAKLKLDKGPGEYKIKCKFKGDDKYNPCNKTKKITIEEEESDYDEGAFYSGQAGRTIYTGEVQEGPDGNWYQHVGYNEWVRI